MSSNFAFVLAGGTGERFWPLSRAALPKHLLRLFGGRTLLENTVRRLEGVVPSENIFVLTNVAQREAAVRELPFLDPRQVIAEPAKRDTAPACALATAIARSRDKDATCAILPADAMIHDGETFRRQLRQAFEAASRGKDILTFAIPPAFPSTGFGYLELGEADADGIFPVSRFVEKPDREVAESYVAGGRHAWNAGIFLWSAELFFEESQRHIPELAKFIEDFPGEGLGDFLHSRFPNLPKISVDYAILEKARSVRALRAGFDWDDVGSWSSLPAHLGTDSSGNCLQGPTAVHESTGNIVLSTGRLIALCGVRDLIIVETPDAILVAHKDSAQHIKALQKLLPEPLK